MRWLRRLFLPVSFMILISAATVVPLPVFVESPGTLLSLGGCVVVELEDTAPVDGDYLLTSVHIGRASTVEVIQAAFSDTLALQPQRDVLPPGVPASEYFSRQREVFRIAAEEAAAVALVEAGFNTPTRARGDGVLVTNVLAGYPAEGRLRPGDVIIRVDGEEVHSAEDLQDRIVSTEPLQITYLREDEQQQTEVAPAERDPGDGQPRPVLGIEIQTLNPQLELPVPVEVRSGRIGGPSAGLMIALTVYDKVAEVDLSAGRRIAGTGTLNAEGRVGPIGGIDLKALSAYRDDADVFLAPAAQAETAQASLPSDSRMEVVPVDTLSQAIARLRDADPAPREPAPPPECALAA